HNQLPFHVGMPGTSAALLCRKPGNTPSAIYCALLEQIEVDRHSHGEIAGAVGVELVARAAGGAFGNEFGLEPAAVRIERRFIEIGDAVEQARGANELVERLALGVLLGRA